MLFHRHETEFSPAAEPQRLCDRTTASVEGRKIVSEGVFSGPCGAATGSQSSDSQSLVCGLGFRWPRGVEGGRANGTQAQAVRRAVVSTGGDPAGRRTGGGFRNGSVDAQADRPGDSASVLSGLSCRACVEGPWPVGLELPATRTEGARAQRRRHQTVGAVPLAAGQKRLD